MEWRNLKLFLTKWLPETPAPTLRETPPPRAAKGEKRHSCHGFDDAEDDDFFRWTIKNTARETRRASSPSDLHQYRKRCGVRAYDSDVFVARWLGPHPHTHCYSTRSWKIKKKSKKEKSEETPARSVPRDEEAPTPVAQSPTVALSDSNSVRERQRPLLLNRAMRRRTQVVSLPKLFCHASCYCSGRIYVSGGLGYSGCTDKLWSLDLGTFASNDFQTSLPKWVTHDESNSQEAAAASVACRRYNHSMVGWNNKLVIFGGDSSPGYLEDLWFYDIGIEKWERIPLEFEQMGRRPGARGGHCAAIWNSQMIVHGGWRGSEGFSDVWSLDLPTLEWTLLRGHVSITTSKNKRNLEEGTVGIFDEVTEGMQIIRRRVVSKRTDCSSSDDDAEDEWVPIGRHWHICCIWKNCLYIHGGFATTGCLRNIWKFDLKKRNWAFVKANGQIPTQRCRQAGDVLDNNWFITGGKDVTGSFFSEIHSFTFDTNTWREISLYQGIPSSPSDQNEWWLSDEIVSHLPHLHCHAAAADTATRSLVITGGCDENCATQNGTLLIRRTPKELQFFTAWQKTLHLPKPQTLQGANRDLKILLMLPSFLYHYPTPFGNMVASFF